MFFDGVLDSSLAFSDNIGSASGVTCTLCALPLSSFYLVGRICDFRIYNKAVPTPVIREMYDPITRWELYNTQRDFDGKRWLWDTAPPAAAGAAICYDVGPQYADTPAGASLWDIRP